MKVTRAEYELSAVDLKGVPPSRLPEVAFAGRSNVGKSSLINGLVGIKGLCRTSSTPGRTRCLNFFLINSSFYFVDLPGYGYARVSPEVRRSFRGMVEPYLASRSDLRGVLLIIDGRHEPMPSDLGMQDWLARREIPYRVVLTKMDKVARGGWRRARERAGEMLGCEEEGILLFSAASGEGKRQVWQAIEEMLEGGGYGSRRGESRTSIPRRKTQRLQERDP